MESNKNITLFFQGTIQNVRFVYGGPIGDVLHSLSCSLSTEPKPLDADGCKLNSKYYYFEPPPI